jgi:peptidoglycan/LPS O-acetylase OafA/YrhL
MKSSEGAYYVGLDHVRALAAFLVVSWHFSHWGAGYPVPLGQSPLFGPFDEGHVGVSLFMTLSGYLFAKLIGERQIRYLPFLWNRAIRLLPLLAVVLFLYAAQRSLEWLPYLKVLAGGALFPVLPNGAWSITIEFHFYLILPFLLAIIRPRPSFVLLLIGASIGLRTLLYFQGLDIQHLAYHTLLGRFDQFAFGIAAYRLRDHISGRTALSALALLWGSYAAFDWMGGYYHFPTPALWLLFPALEGLTIALMIAWYDRNPLRGRGMWLVGKAGEYSYSIYLLHFFVVAQAAQYINEHVMRMPDLMHSLPWAMLFFLMMIAVGHASWTFIEQPALRWRKPYFAEPEGRATAAAMQVPSASEALAR